MEYKNPKAGKFIKFLVRCMYEILQRLNVEN